VLYAGFANEVEWSIGARHGGRVGANNAYRIYAKHRGYDDTITPLAGADPDAWSFTQTGFRVDGGDPQSAVAWTVQGDAYRGSYASATGPSSRNEGANLLARLDASLTNGTELGLRVYHDYTMRRVPGSVWEHLRTSDAEFQHRLQPRAGHRLVWGAHYRYMNEAVHFATDDLAILPVDRDLRLGGLFVQDAFEAVPEVLQLTAGLRLEYNNFSDWEVQPSLRASWTVSPEHTVWAAVSRATRTPSRIDTDFYLPAQPPYVVAGGPDFESEILVAYELGWRGQLAPGAALTLTVYHHDYDKLRAFALGDPILVTNDLAGHSTGLEATFDWQVSERWRLRGGGFLLDAETDYRPGDSDIEAGRGEASDPGYQFLLRSGYDLTRDLLLWLGLRRIGSVPIFDNGVDAGRIPAYTELDATLRWQVRPGVEWLLIGRNLLHDAHPEIGESAATRHEVERSVHLMIRWDF
jgi:iron complex outermembrane receptor protein